GCTSHKFFLYGSARRSVFILLLHYPRKRLPSCASPTSSFTRRSGSTPSSDRFGIKRALSATALASREIISCAAAEEAMHTWRAPGRAYSDRLCDFCAVVSADVMYPQLLAFRGPAHEFTAPPIAGKGPGVTHGVWSKLETMRPEIAPHGLMIPPPPFGDGGN